MFSAIHRDLISHAISVAEHGEERAKSLVVSALTSFILLTLSDYYESLYDSKRESEYWEKGGRLADNLDDWKTVWSSDSESADVLSSETFDMHIKKTKSAQDFQGALHLRKLVAVTYRLERNENKAIERYQKILEMFMELFGDEAHETLATMVALGDIYWRNLEHEKALSLNRAVYAVRKRSLGNTDELAESCVKIARLVFKSGDFDEAIRYAQEAAIIYLELQGMHHPETISTIHELAFYLKGFEDYGSAIALFRIIFERLAAKPYVEEDELFRIHKSIRECQEKLDANGQKMAMPEQYLNERVSFLAKLRNHMETPEPDNATTTRMREHINICHGMYVK